MTVPVLGVILFNILEYSDYIGLYSTYIRRWDLLSSLQCDVDVPAYCTRSLPFVSILKDRHRIDAD
jgi:hypothetical protein